MNQVDILNKNFTCNGCANSKTLLELKNIVNEYCISFNNPKTHLDNDSLNIAQECISKIEELYIDNFNVGLFIQRISDFNNGILFKQILQQKKHEGFIFNESNRKQGTDTVCIFSPLYLSPPQKYFVQTDNL